MTDLFRYALLTLASLALAFPLSAQEEGRSLSPYFLVKSERQETGLMPLRLTEVEAEVLGAIAEVTVRQTYFNQSDLTLEALYVFPASTRAAVHGLTMKVGGRTVQARAETRQKAREEYEAARSAGQRATLLEQDRPNVFRMQLANIGPGDSIEVTLSYTETLLPTDGVYEFVYPNVVAPRYTGKSNYEQALADNAVTFEYLEEGQAQRFAFEFKARIEAGMPVRGIESPSHQIETKGGDGHARLVRLHPSERYEANRDFVLRYRLGGEGLGSGALTYEGEEERFFMVTVQPPEAPKQIDAPPTEFVFLMDVSGSMKGFPLEASQTFVETVLSGLRPSDRFNIVLFDLTPKLMSETPVPVTRENVDRAVAYMNSGFGGGATELVKGLSAALRTRSQEAGTARTVVVLTDGQVTVEKEAMRLIRRKLGEANLFAMGVGRNVNRFAIEGMARAGRGEPIFITEAEGAKDKARAFARYVSTPALTDVRVSYEGFEPYELNMESVCDVLAQRPVVVYGKYKGAAEGGAIVVSGLAGGGERFERRIALSEAAPDPRNGALKYLWARDRVGTLYDELRISPTVDAKQAITEIGLKYNMLTPYTSFIAVEEALGGEEMAYRLPTPGLEGESGGGSQAPRTFTARGLADKTVDLLTPERSNYYRSEGLIRWKACGEGEPTYVVAFSNLFGEEVASFETQATELKVDLSAGKLGQESGLTYTVSVKGGEARSPAHSLSMLRRADRGQANVEIAEHIDAETPAERLALAKVYERRGLFVHALLVYAGLAGEGGDYEAAYLAFLEKHGLAE